MESGNSPSTPRKMKTSTIPFRWTYVGEFANRPQAVKSYSENSSARPGPSCRTAPADADDAARHGFRVARVGALEDTTQYTAHMALLWSRKETAVR